MIRAAVYAAQAVLCASCWHAIGAVCRALFFRACKGGKPT